MNDSIGQAAQFIASHRLARLPLPALDPSIRPLSEAAAYDVQEQLHDALAARGQGAIAGHKIGCTTAVMQAFLRIPNPCAGGVFSSTVRHRRAVFAHGDFLHVGVECEIVVWMDADLPPASAPYDRQSVAEAVGACSAGMELVDDRYVDYKSLDTPTLIADDFFDAAVVIGEPYRDWRSLDLSALGGTTRINDREVGKGRGSDVMGHPLEALAWLAKSLARRGQFLRKGQFVFTGSLVETKWVNRGDHVVMEVDGLGSVEAEFG
ncbi:MAG: hydratase [Betaproteobacteria bacterium]|nr:hydratase [Betaproteobacteria bacterium]